MGRQALICPVCGAPHRRVVPAGVVHVKCSYCGATIVVPTDAPRCPNHPYVLATAVCNDCGSNYCRACLSAYEVKGNGEGGTLQLCSNCLKRRHLEKAERTILVGIILALFGVFNLLIVPIVGVFLIAFVATPIIIYGVYSARRLDGKRAVPPPGHAKVGEEKSHRTTQEIYRDTLNEFVKSFGMAHGSIMLENRLKAYVKEGYTREEAVRRLAEDHGC